MNDYLNSLFAKRSYVLLFCILPVPMLFLWIYIAFKFFDVNWMLFGEIVVVVWIYIAYQLDRNKECAWCKSRDISCLNTELNTYYSHSKKDGSADNRYKNNKLVGRLTSIYKCNKCIAETEFCSESVSNASKKTKIVSKTLVKNGDGRRQSSDDYYS